MARLAGLCQFEACLGPVADPLRLCNFDGAALTDQFLLRPSPVSSPVLPSTGSTRGAPTTWAYMQCRKPRRGWNRVASLPWHEPGTALVLPRVRSPHQAPNGTGFQMAVWLVELPPPPPVYKYIPEETSKRRWSQSGRVTMGLLLLLDVRMMSTIDHQDAPLRVLPMGLAYPRLARFARFATTRRHATDRARG
jgi:hypothetical protein